MQLAKLKGRLVKLLKRLLWLLLQEPRSRESIICTVDSDVEDSSDASEHEENCSNPDINVAVADLSNHWTQDLSGFSLFY